MMNDNMNFVERELYNASIRYVRKYEFIMSFVYCDATNDDVFNAQHALIDVLNAHDIDDVLRVALCTFDAFINHDNETIDALCITCDVVTMRDNDF